MNKTDLIVKRYTERREGTEAVQFLDPAQAPLIAALFGLGEYELAVSGSDFSLKVRGNVRGGVLAKDLAYRICRGAYIPVERDPRTLEYRATGLMDAAEFRRKWMEDPNAK